MAYFKYIFLKKELWWWSFFNNSDDDLTFAFFIYWSGRGKAKRNKIQIFNEIYITLNKILGEYDNILRAGDLNIDELKPDWDSSNHLFDAKDAFNLTNLVKKPTCFKSQDGTLIRLMLTNKTRSFLKSQNFEIGLSDCHKFVVSILRVAFKKLPRKIITYRKQKKVLN